MTLQNHTNLVPKSHLRKLKFPSKNNRTLIFIGGGS